MSEVTDGLLEEGRLVGRSEQLDRLERRLIEGERWLSLVGTPGIGKSRLAVELARRLVAGEAARFEEVALVDLEAAESELLHERLEQRLEASGMEAPTCIVLDQCERLERECLRTVGRELLGETEHCVIATGDRPIQLDVEAFVRVPPLSVEWAAELYRIRADEGNRPVGSNDDEAVRQLVAALDRIPLAIEAVASLDTVLSPAELTEQVGRLGGVLGLVEQMGDDRLLARLERTVRRAWRGLTESERVTLAESACWGGSFVARAAGAVVSPVCDGDREIFALLDGLCRKSVVWRSEASQGGPPRFHVPGLVSEFARRETAPQVDLEATRRRMVRYYVESGEALIEHRLGTRDLTSVADIGDEIPNIVEAFELAAETDVRDAVELAVVLVRYDAEFEMGGEAESFLDRAFELIERAGDYQGRLRDRCRLEHVRAVWAMRRRRLDRARPAYRRALEYAEQLEDVAKQVDILTDFAFAENAAERFDEGDRRIERARELVPRVDDPNLKANVWVNIGLLYMNHRERRTDRARTALRRGAAICRQHEIATRGSKIMSNLGFLEISVDRFELGRDYLRESFRDARKRGIRRIEMMVDAGLGCCALAADELEEARRRLTRSAEGAGEAEFYRLQLDALNWLGLLELRAGKMRRCRQLLDEAMEVGYLTEDDCVRMANTHGGRAAAAYLSGDDAAGERAYAEARSLAERSAADRALKTIEVFEAFRPIGRAGRGAEQEERREIRAGLREARAIIEREDEEEGGRFYLGSGDACLVARIVGHLLEEYRQAWFDASSADSFEGLRVDARGRWFALPETGRVDLSNRSAPRLIFEHLVERRRGEAGAASDVYALLEVGWPDEELLPESGKARVYVAIQTLRDLGLRQVLETGAEGYRLDPDIPFEVVDPSGG